VIDLLGHVLVQNAFLAGTIVAILAGFVGYFVLLRGQAFATEALSHVGFAGATGAALVGASSLEGMFLFTILAAIAIGSMGKRLRGRDIEVGMVLTFMLGLGVLFLSIYTQNATAVVSVLFGSILNVTATDMILTLLSGLLTISVMLFLFRPLIFASIDPEAAESRGVPVRWLSVVFLILLALSVSEAVKVVGVLLVFALIVVPAATAERLTYEPFQSMLLAILISLLCTWGGLILAFIGHWPVSFYIVSLTAVFYFISLGLQTRLSPRGYREVPHPSREMLPPDP
jgi:zinc/manganese transport system permease protein